MNILIVKMSALGDVTHTLPALTTIRRHLPQARITWLVEELAADIVRGHRALDRLLVWPRREWVRLARSGRILALAVAVIRFVRELRDTPYDLIIDFQALLKSAAWVALARATRKAGYGPGLRREERSWIALNELVAVTKPDAHAVERNVLLLEGLGFARLPLLYDFPVFEEDDAIAGRLLREEGIPEGSLLVAINPVSRWPTKNWSRAHFAAVADGLIRAGWRVVFTGATGDGDAIGEIVAAMEHRPARCDGRTNLKALAALFRRAQVVVSTDTGPMHMAVAVGTPVVGLFGPTSPGYTGPYGEGNVVLRVGIACSPCFKRSCETREYEKHACMLRLQPRDVIDAVLGLEARRRGGSPGDPARQPQVTE